MSKFKMFIPITKIDIEKHLVYGLATAEKRDRSNEICDYETTKPFYQKWSEEVFKASGGKNYGNVRAMHGKVAAGKVFQPIVFNDVEKQVEICAEVVDAAEWEKVEKGIYTGFSQGGRYVKSWKDPADATLTRYTAEPGEVSLVDWPCLPESTFAAIKAGGATEMRKFVSVIAEPTDDEVLAKALELAGGDVTKKDTFIPQAKEELVTDLLAKAKKDDSGDDNKGTGAAANKDDDATDKDPKDKKKKKNEKFFEPKGPFWKCDHDDHQHLQKSDAVSCMKQDEALAKAAEVTNPVKAELDKLTAALDGKDPVKVAVVEFVKAWKPETEIPLSMSEQMITIFPELTVKSFEKGTIGAIMTTLQKAMVEPPKPAPVVDTSKLSLGKMFSLMRKAAKEKTEVPELIKKGDEAKALAKGLYDVSRLCSLISELVWLQQSMEYEAITEGDGSSVPQAFKTNIAAICANLRDMVVEETAELFQDDDDGIILLEMAAGLTSTNTVDAMVKSGVPIAYIETLRKHASPFVGLDDLLVKAKEVFEKTGARHSKADLNRVQSIHDAACELGAGCGDDDEAAKGSPRGALMKGLVTENDEMKKQLGDMIPQIQKLTAKVQALEAQPAPAKAAARVVGKRQDSADEDASPEVVTLAQELDKMTPADRSLSLMKLALRNPVAVIPATPTK